MSNGEQIGKEIGELAARFEALPPEEVIRWALQRFGQKVALATGFGPEGCVLVHILAGVRPDARFTYLDTGVLFEETYGLRDRLEARYGVRFERFASDLSLEEQAAHFGPELWKTNPDRCCHLRKVEPLYEMTAGLDAWITAIRRDQSPTRASAKVVEWDAKFRLIKINPLVRWTSQEVWKFIADNDIPYNPLHDQGYPSIGCRPCTSPVQIGEDPRAGRWRGIAKTECGLHSSIFNQPVIINK